MSAKPSLSALATEWNNMLLYYSCLVSAEMKESPFVAHFSAYEHRLANPMIRLNDPDNWKNLYRHCNKKDMYHYIDRSFCILKL